MSTQLEDVIEYQGIQLPAISAPYVESRLADAWETTKCSMRGNEKVMACRFEIRIPNSYMSGFFFDGNKLANNLVNYVRNIVRNSHKNGNYSQESARRPSSEVIWQARMVNGNGLSYRIVLLLNPEAYYKQHPYKMPQEVVMNRIVHAWSRVSNQSASAATRQVQFPYGWIQDVESSRYGLEEIFPKISVLCTEPDGHNGAVFAGFGTTRRS